MELQLDESELVDLAHKILEVRANRNLRAFLEEVWGNLENIDTVMLYSVNEMGGESVYRINVWDKEHKLLPPNFSLPFWTEEFYYKQGDYYQEPNGYDDDEELLGDVNSDLYHMRIFREMGLPDPKDESPLYQFRTKLSELPVEYPSVCFPR